MSLVLNMVGGGGGSAYAFILANHPSGATCTCSGASGSKDISATQKLFYIPSANTYTVSISQTGQTTKTQAVVISYEGQSEEITMSFFSATLRVFTKDGAIVTATKDGISVTGTVSGTYVDLSIQQSGTWSVTDDQAYAILENISITEQTTYEHTILHRAYLVSANDGHSDITGGWGNWNGVTGQFTENGLLISRNGDWGNVRTNSKVPLSIFTTLVIVSGWKSADYGKFEWKIDTNAQPTDASTTIALIQYAGTSRIDISNYVDAYIGVGMAHLSTLQGYVTEAYMEY